MVVCLYYGVCTVMKVELLDTMGSDLSVVNAARVSYSKISEELNDKDEKLINTILIKRKRYMDIFLGG